MKAGVAKVRKRRSRRAEVARGKGVAKALVAKMEIAEIAEMEGRS